jgi:mannosyltransferase OCH1-like enzyme
VHTKSEKKFPAIPKKFHFIWVGGPLPEKYFSTIAQLASAALNNHFEINLWVDNPRNYESTSIKLDREIPNLRIRNINELHPKMEQDKFYQEENRLSDYQSCIDRERIGLKNLGAVSDLLRLEILRQEGGYYLDTDTTFEGLTPDSKLVTQRPRHGICAAAYPTGDLI